MKTRGLFLISLSLASVSWADGLPVITSQPQSQTVAPGSNAIFSVTATGATDYRWRFNGTFVPVSGGTNATLTVTNAQATNAGYYMVLVKNPVGWVPSSLAYLSVVDTPGTVPFSNRSNALAEADYPDGYGSYFGPITNGTARVVAGPALDQMQPIGSSVSVPNGYFNAGTRSVPTVAPGQTVYYRVTVSYPDAYNPSATFTQLSTVLKLTAGGGSYPLPSVTNLYFPGWLEWPQDPYFLDFLSTPTNRVYFPGESFTLTNFFQGYGDLGVPNFQWRKDGKEIGVPMNFSSNSPVDYVAKATLPFTGLTPNDGGIYDVVVLGNNWFVGRKTVLSVQLTNGPGQLLSPRLSGSNFIVDLVGVQGRNYRIQISSNLSTWSNLVTLTNVTGAVTITNPAPSASRIFYRAQLVP